MPVPAELSMDEPSVPSITDAAKYSKDSVAREVTPQFLNVLPDSVLKFIVNRWTVRGCPHPFAYSIHARKTKTKN